RYTKADPATRRDTVMFRASDIAGYVKALSASAPVPVRRPLLESHPIVAIEKPVPAPPAAAARWLTVAEAAVFTGLPESAILKLIAAGMLKAIDCGPRPGGRYRMRPIDLDQLEGERITPSCSKADLPARASAKRIDGSEIGS